MEYAEREEKKEQGDIRLYHLQIYQDVTWICCLAFQKFQDRGREARQDRLSCTIEMTCIAEDSPGISDLS